MRVSSEHARYEILSIMHTIRKDKDSWEGWQCLRIETPRLETRSNPAKVHADLMQLLAAQLKSTEGAVFLCGLEDILVFCKNVPEATLKSIGRQALDMIVEQTSLAANYTVFDVCKDSDRLAGIGTYDCLVREGEHWHPAELEKISSQFSFPLGGIKTEQPVKIDSRKVLLVEDDPIIRWAIRGVLKDECLLATAQDFDGAVSLYHSYNPDVVFLDINLPGKSGKEVMAHILQSDPGAYIVICSSHDNMENIVGFLEDGAKGFISKPFRKERLLQYVHNCPH